MIWSKKKSIPFHVHEIDVKTVFTRPEEGIGQSQVIVSINRYTRFPSYVDFLESGLILKIRVISRPIS